MRISNKDNSTQKSDWVSSWHVAPGSGGNNIEFLDGVRGVAILLVVFCHLFYINPNATGIVKFIGNTISAGNLGVTVFFTLSGFLISLPFWKNKLRNSAILPRNYFQRRFWKIYPPLALSVVLLTPCYILVYGNSALYAETAVKWLLGIAWFTPVSGKLNPVMWSLIVEVHFYLILPLAFFGLRKIGYRTTMWLIFIGFLVVPPIAKLIYASYGMEFGLHPVIQVLFPIKLDAFAAGTLIGAAYQSGRMSPRLAILGHLGVALLSVTFLLCGVAVFVPSLQHIWTDEARNYSTMLATGGILCFVGQPAKAAYWGLCFGWLRWLGLISYELYLFHQPPHIWLKKILGPADGDIGKYLLITGVPLMASVILAAIVYRKFSLPILRRQRG